MAWHWLRVRIILENVVHIILSSQLLAEIHVTCAAATAAATDDAEDRVMICYVLLCMMRLRSACTARVPLPAIRNEVEEPRVKLKMDVIPAEGTKKQKIAHIHTFHVVSRKLDAL